MVLKLTDQLHVLIYKNRISIRVNNRETRRTMLSGNRIIGYLYTFRFEMLKQLTHIIE